jgi:hypothetical protein
MTGQSDLAIYRLLQVPGMNPAALHRVLGDWRLAPSGQEEFWELSDAEYQERFGLSERSVRYLLREAGSSEPIRRAAGCEERAREAGIEILSVLDPWYQRLAGARSLPPLLFTRGNQDLLWESGPAVLFSRDASEAALAWGAGLAAELAAGGITLVTGHNRDGYRRAAAAAKRYAAPVVLVLDRPLHERAAATPLDEPVAAARIWDPDFRPERQVVVSPFGPDERWTPRHARARDALVVRLASGVIAGDLRSGGTMEALCTRAAADGRLVFRSPFCRLGVPGLTLPDQSSAAAARVRDELCTSCSAEGDCGRTHGFPYLRPGWLEGRWQREIDSFLEALEKRLGTRYRIEARSTGPMVATHPDEQQESIQAAVRCVLLVPADAEDSRYLAVLVSPRYPEQREGNDVAGALLLTPEAPIATLAALRHYLQRCGARVVEALQKSTLFSIENACSS